MKSTRPIPFFIYLHPFLIALYSPLSMWLANIDQVQAFATTRPLLFSLISVVLALAFGLVVFRKISKAAIFASLVLILFFSYGHVFQLIDTRSIGGFMYGRHRFLLPLWLAFLLLGLVEVWRARTGLKRVNHAMALTSLFLVIFVLAQIGFLKLTQWNLSRTAVQQVSTGLLPQDNHGSENRPDVYYIILDAYARADILASQHGLDTRDFIQQLTNLGFYVAHCSQSNYVWTPLSIGSSLNMNYLDAMGVPMDPNAERIHYWDFTHLLSRSAARQAFESMGYQSVTFKTVYPWLDIADSTVYYNVETSTSFFDLQESLNFQYLFMRTTAMRLLLEAQEKSPERFDRLPPVLLQMVNPKANLFTNRRARQYEQNIFALEKLSEIPQLPGPKFVYAHLFTTHQPYVFNRDGSMRWQEVENMEAYNEQVLYTNDRILEVLKQILADSETPPIVVLQSDHGYATDSSRVLILNAYYLPGGGETWLYPSISPVNTFRGIFNQYFQGSYPLLEDISFYSSGERPYRLEDVSFDCPAETP